MATTEKKRGQKLSQKFNRISRRATRESHKHIHKNLVSRLPHARNVRLLILEWSLLLGALILLAITQTFWYINSYSITAPTTGGTYTEATLGEVDTLNPLFADTSSEQTLSKLTFATLTAVDSSGHTGYALADSITSDTTGKIWTLKLRDGLKWSDGAPITNQDVLYTVALIQNSSLNTSYSSNLTRVSLAEQDGALVFTLPSAYANFPTALNIPILPSHILKDVAPAKLLEHEFSTTSPVTSGPFTYNAAQAVSASEKVFYLSANPNYYQGQPLIDTFAIHTFPTTDAILEALNSGTITATAELSAADSPSSSSIAEKQTTLNSGVYAFLNTSSQTLNNKTLRQAIQQGLDLPTLRSVLDDEPALDYPILSSQFDGITFPSLPATDKSAATETIKQFGLTEANTLEIATVSTGRLPALANALAEQLESLGFDTHVSTYTPDQDFLYNVIRQRAYDILIYEIDLGPDPDIFPYYHSSQATASGLNLSNYRNAVVDELILSARSSINPTTRAAKYSAFLRYWVDNVPVIGIYQTTLTYYYNQNTTNFSENNHLVYPTDRFNDVQHWSVLQTTKNRTP